MSVVITADFLVQLRHFLAEANQHGYAAGESDKWIKEPDGSTTIVYEYGPWKYHDNFFGGEPYGGREVVFYQNQAVWMMVYYGYVVDEAKAERNEIYRFLREALSQPNERDLPVRGPGSYGHAAAYSIYFCEYAESSNLSRFKGWEEIYRKGLKPRTIYRATFSGGLVDQSVAL